MIQKDVEKGGREKALGVHATNFAADTYYKRDERRNIRQDAIA